MTTGLPRTLTLTPAGRLALRTIRAGAVVGVEPVRSRPCGDCGRNRPHRRIIHQHGRTTIGVIVCNHCEP